MFYLQLSLPKRNVAIAIRYPYQFIDIQGATNDVNVASRNDEDEKRNEEVMVEVAIMAIMMMMMIVSLKIAVLPWLKLSNQP